MPILQQGDLVSTAGWIDADRWPRCATVNLVAAVVALALELLEIDVLVRPLELCFFPPVTHGLRGGL